MQAGSKRDDAGTCASAPKRRKRLTIRALLRPHAASLALGFVAVVGEAVANLLQPWPFKIVLDEVFKNHAGRSDLPHFVYRFVGADRFATIKFACIAKEVIKGALAKAVKKAATKIVEEAAAD